MTNNTILKVVPINKNGRTFYNFVAIATLNNGQVATFQIKLAFYNKNFAYKLSQQLPQEGK